MKILEIIFIILSISTLACQQEINIDADNIGQKDGLTINNETGKPLHGRYKCISSFGKYSVYHVETFEYKNGIKVGKWTYSFNGDLIHHGRFLKENSLKTRISKLTQTKRTELHLWQEGDYVWLDVNLIEPQNSTSLIQTQIVQLVKDNMAKKYDVNLIRIQVIQDDKREVIYREEVKELSR